MDSFQFDQKLFQRGQTWLECMESWVFRRDLFLERALQHFSLPETESVVGARGDLRLAVLYHPRLLDVMKTLPILGNVLSRLHHLEIRFFNQGVYFPVLYQPFGRVSPQLLLLDDDGHTLKQWGPRPEPVTRELSNTAGDVPGEIDRMLWDYDDGQFCRFLDDALVVFFSPA